jgi:hypothetical protein
MTTDVLKAMPEAPVYFSYPQLELSEMVYWEKFGNKERI